MNVLQILITVPMFQIPIAIILLVVTYCICKSGYEIVDGKCDGYNKLQYLYYIFIYVVFVK